MLYNFSDSNIEAIGLTTVVRLMPTMDVYMYHLSKRHT